MKYEKPELKSLNANNVVNGVDCDCNPNGNSAICCDVGNSACCCCNPTGTYHA